MTYPLAALQKISPGTALVGLGAVSLYFASRAAADALAAGDPKRAGWRAVGHCLPIAVVALLCLHPAMGRPGITPPGVGRPEIAVGLLFSSSVACLTLVLGIVVYLRPSQTLPASRKVWPFVLPAALLALIAGFSGTLTLLHACMLALLGAAVFNLWLGAWREEAIDASENFQGERCARDIRWQRWLEFALATALSIIGGWAITRGVAKVEQSHRLMTAIVMAGGVLGPLLALPVLGSTSRLAERGHGGSAISTLVAIVLINLCALLPLVALTHVALQVPALLAGAPKLNLAYFTQQFWPSLPSVPFPIVSWRIDTVMLMLVGLAMIPWSIGRWTIGRGEAMALVLVYAIYLALVAAISVMRY